MKKALVYDPYMDTLGGGERYALTFAKILSDSGFEVDIAWKEDQDFLQKVKDRFDLDLSKVTLREDIHLHFTQKGNLIQRYAITKQYDLIFFVSDGSIPFLFGKKNYLHFQVPYSNLKISIVDRIKLLFIKKIIYNSLFTKSVVDKKLRPTKSMVLYPPIDTDSLPSSERKQNIILSVGRFDSPSHPKRQDVLIKAFRLFYEQNNRYSLFLVGGLKAKESSLKKLKTLAKGLPVYFVINPSFKELQGIYKKAKFFWHSAGYDIDEQKNPEKVEHFGMTTVEAMSSGSVPIVIAKGGQKEIITSGTGILCDSPEEMAHATSVLASNNSNTKEISINAIKKSKQYSIQSFEEKIISQLL